MQNLAWTEVNIIYDFKEVSEIPPKSCLPQHPYVFHISELIPGLKTQPGTKANNLNRSIGQRAEAKPFVSWVSPKKS